MDRKELNTALAKAIAFKLAGNETKASEWGKKLVKLLNQEGINC